MNKNCNPGKKIHEIFDHVCCRLQSNNNKNQAYQLNNEFVSKRVNNVSERFIGLHYLSII
jgi:hypothetical protein